MICLGEKQELVIVKKVEFGVYLAVSFEEAAEHVLLPVKQVPEDSEVGDKLEVFVYRDSKDRIIATVNEPLLCMGKVAELTVVTVGRFGAFLDWGLEKDLLLPFREQRGVVKPGGKVLVSLYIDKSSRLCATMNVYASLRTDSPYQAEDRVRGRVYELSDNFGAFVAVDNLYSGLIAKKELYGKVVPGMDIEARVLRVRADGKLDLSVREKAHLQMNVDADRILALLDSYEGALPFSDKAAPEVIEHETGMSKNEFKRAVGRLLKQGKIEIGEKTIRRVNS
ncbi:MAG: RNA-binding protein [Lachnospiraceae bacterium]|jgi:predicted RNA-binding protein (virulence factor B family)|nr:RNA-binding protein [Lachnospiraceae bacterium]MCX4304860.1 S1-like domain-containing RNA-binding protein [Acetatifactor sp.]